MSRFFEALGSAGLKLATFVGKIIPGFDTYVEDFEGLIRWSFILLVLGAAGAGGWLGWQHFMGAKKAVVEDNAATSVRVERAVKKNFADNFLQRQSQPMEQNHFHL